MRKTKKIILSLFTVIFYSLSLVGCGASGNPAEYAKMFWDFKIKQDISNIDKLGLTINEGQEIIDTSKESEMEDLKNMIEESVGVYLRNEYLNKIYNQYIKTLSLNEVKVDNGVKSGKKSTIKISTTYIDITDIIYKAKEKASNEVKALKLTTDAAISENLASRFTECFIEGLKNAQVSTDTVEKEFTFIYSEEEYWIPENSQEFMMAMGEMSTK